VVSLSAEKVFLLVNEAADSGLETVKGIEGRGAVSAGRSFTFSSDGASQPACSARSRKERRNQKKVHCII
jgi:hypothetical protein